MATCKQLILDGESALATDAGFEGNAGARLDAEILLGFALKQSRTWLYTWPDHIPWRTHCLSDWQERILVS